MCSDFRIILREERLGSSGGAFTVTDRTGLAKESQPWSLGLGPTRNASAGALRTVLEHHWVVVILVCESRSRSPRGSLETQ